MIFHRLAVSHFKGIKGVDIQFAPRGITLVEGRNEIGKSSLVHALTTLFEEPIKRTRRTLEHLIPKDGSGTPEIELEAESGEYRFVYRKKYIENKAVELTLLGPDSKKYEGGEAQEKFEKILNETLDRSLWKALMLQQGTAVGLPEVKDQQALMSALDNAVASPAGAPDVESLYAKIAEEYGKYYHSGHAGELQSLRDLRAAVDAAANAEKDARNRVEELEGKIVTSRRLRQELRSLNSRDETERRALKEFGRRLTEVETLEKALDAEKAKQDRAREKRTAAERGLEDRKRLAVMVERAEELLKRTTAVYEKTREAEEDAVRIAQEKKDALGKCNDKREKCERMAALRRADYEYLRDKLDLGQMTERKARIDASAVMAEGARKELARNIVTEKALDEIRAAEKNALLAHARREGAAPRMRLDAISSCGVVVDGNTRKLSAGETVEVSVAETASFEIPGLLSVTVTPGDSAGTLDEQCGKAERQLRRLLGKYGVENPDDAPALLEKRRAAERIIADHKRIERENLRDLNYSGDAGGLVERIRELEEKTAAYPLSRSGEVPLPRDLDQAKRDRGLAEDELGAVMEEWREAEASRETAEKARRSAKDDLIRMETEKDGAGRELERLRQTLGEARDDVADEELHTAYTDADAGFSSAARAVAVVETELKGLGPERVRERLETLGNAVTKTAGEISDTRERLARLQAELELLGGNGLNEKAEEAGADLDHRKRILEAELRKAGAAKLLYEVVSRARDASQQAYVLPLKKRIEELARYIYASDVSVELTPDLQIANRIINGQTVAFSHLSGGAREQFSLIHRAACSLMVARDGGVPLILDDALGYSDNERLIGMNDVLSRAAHKCQIIIMTCMPNRYTYLTPERTIDLEKEMREGIREDK